MTLRPMTAAPDDVVGEHFAGRRMQWDEAILAELGATNRQHRCLQIDILKLEVARFAQAQTRDAE